MIESHEKVVRRDLRRLGVDKSTVVHKCFSSEARSALSSKLLYADDLVLMAPTMKQLGRRVAEWRGSLLDKGLKANE